MSLFSGDEERRVSDAITQAERKTSGEIVVVVAARSDTYLYVPPLIGALVSLLLPWPLIFFTKLDVEMIYLAQLALFLVLTALLLPHAHARRVRAGAHQEAARAPARGGAVHRPEPPHHDGAYGRAHLRLGGRALRGDPRRHRHRRAGARRGRGNRSSTSSPPPVPAASRPTGWWRPSGRSERISPAISRPTRATSTSFPII